MPSHFELPTHCYSDKAVQTEQVFGPALCEKEPSLLQKPSFAVSLCGVVETRAAGETAVSSESAYIPSKMPSSSSSTFLGNNKAWLGFNGPSSGFDVAQRRVVSVPDSSRVKTVVDRNIRIVSMPDSNGCKVSMLDDTDDYVVQEVGSRLLGLEQYSDDLPESPSPPSSPDSILVTGNESRIHGSIFSHDADENGWITWANSPPRPIPALHGPSSLPYARCPSGAEGTVVEGGDLTNKVWGLGSDETNGTLRSKSSQSSYTTSITSRVLFSDDDRLGKCPDLMHRRDTVIDFSEPSMIYGCPDAYTSFPRHVASIGRGSYPPSGFHSAMTEAKISDHTCEHMAHVANGTQNPIALESKWQNLSGSRQCASAHTPQIAAKSHFNSSAPIFVPAARREFDPYIQRDSASDFGHSRARTFSESVTSRELHIHPSLELLTPSSTTSPRWSPVFQPAIPIAVAGANNPRIYSPNTDFGDHSNQFFIERSGHDIRNRLLPETCEKSPVDMFLSQRESPRTGKLEAQLTNFQPINTQNKGVPKSYQTLQSQRRHNFSSQQPRSIPLVRLIQRRLSSVAEEEASRYDLVLPKAQTKGPNMKPTPRSTVQAETAVRELIDAASLEYRIGATGSAMRVKSATTPNITISSCAGRTDVEQIGRKGHGPDSLQVVSR